MIKLTVKGLKDIQKMLNEEEKNIVNSMAHAHSKVASQAVKVLKQGLRTRAGRDTSDPGYMTSPKGALPFMHSGALRQSIGFKLLRHGKTVSSEVGSGASDASQVKYAKYLEGYNGDGIRPFLWAINKIYTPANIIKAFNNYYRISVKK